MFEVNYEIRPSWFEGTVAPSIHKGTVRRSFDELEFQRFDLKPSEFIPISRGLDRLHGQEFADAYMLNALLENIDRIPEDYRRSWTEGRVHIFFPGTRFASSYQKSIMERKGNKDEERKVTVNVEKIASLFFVGQRVMRGMYETGVNFDEGCRVVLLRPA